jgi:hypothetical protein
LLVVVVMRWGRSLTSVAVVPLRVRGSQM